MKRFVISLLAATCLAGLPAVAQNVPEIAFDSATNALTTPDDIYLGEVSGVASDSKGNVYVYTRTGHPTVTLGGARNFAHGGSRLFQFDRNGIRSRLNIDVPIAKFSFPGENVKYVP